MKCKTNSAAAYTGCGKTPCGKNVSPTILPCPPQGEVFGVQAEIEGAALKSCSQKWGFSKGRAAAKKGEQAGWQAPERGP